MINILFPVGSFGTTLEFCLHTFSNELTKIDTDWQSMIKPDGSMHHYNKEFHPRSFDEWDSSKKYQVSTPVYPNRDYLTPAESVIRWKSILPKDSKTVFVHFNSIAQAQRNALFAHHKLKEYTTLERDTLKDKSSSWGADGIDNIEPWQKREALSFYITDQKIWLDVDSFAPENSIKITPDDILYNFEETLAKIFDYLGLTFNDADIKEFHKKWFSAQQYILNEYTTICKIVDSILADEYYSWDPISIFGEAIVQSRLTENNFDLKCFKLNDFPTDTDTLKNYLEKV